MLKDWGKLALTSALGVFLSSSFVFLAALPIRFMRLDFGRAPFILLSLSFTLCLLGFQQWQWALVYFSLSFLIAVYSEMELQHYSVFSSASVAIGLTGLTTAFGFGLVAKHQGFTLMSFLEAQLLPIQEQFAAMPQIQELSDVPSIIGYLPSGVAIALMLALFIALSIFSDESGTKNSLLLKKFRLPDLAIWVFIGSLAGTFLFADESVNKLICTNILSISAAAYFFQGLAVVTSYLDAYRVFGFWRLLLYFLIFFQMFILVSGLGILDFWFDFRTRLRAKKNLSSRREEKS